jgi:hypothetical protein
LKIYDGAVSFRDLEKLGYEDACNLYDYAVKINEEEQKHLEQLNTKKINGR